MLDGFQDAWRVVWKEDLPHQQVVLSTINIVLSGCREFRVDRSADYRAVKGNKAAQMPQTIRSAGLLALGRAIVEIRTSRGMSQREFAGSIGWEHTMLGKVELGVRRLDVAEFIVLARAMEVDAADLLRKVEEAISHARKV